MPARGGVGIAMRGGVFLEAAHQIGDVDLMVVPIFEIRPEDAAFARTRCVRLMIVENRDRQDTLFSLIRDMADDESRLSMFEQYGKPPICSILSAPVLRDSCDFVASDSYDMTVVQRSYMFPVVEAVRRKTTLGRIVFDLDDDDSGVFLELAERERSKGAEVSARWHELEASAFDNLLVKIDALAHLTTVANKETSHAISQRLESRRPIMVSNCIEIVAQTQAATEPVLLFVGTMGYKPNEEGVLWLLKDVFPLVRKSVPDAQLIIAGRDADRVLQSIRPRSGVTIISDPDDLAVHYRSSAVAVVPLFVGSGTRIKILEAGAYGRAVVSTKKGAEGLDIENGKHAWIVEAEAEPFARACTAALQSHEERERRARLLRDRVRLMYERKVVTDRLANLLRGTVTLTE